jgi:hypothetical protein
MIFIAARHRDAEGRYRWAALEPSTRTFYFPRRYGYKAALAYATRLNIKAQRAAQ